MKQILLLFLWGTFSVFSQHKPDTLRTNPLEEVIITTKKINKTQNLFSQQTDVIRRQEIEFQNFQNTADMLGNSGLASVQKSQQGGGSPVIRGFEASRILLLVDGIRMNNLIFRTGHLQNIITIDENMLENTELFYGSGSTLFGSDALGGAINLNTKKALFSSEKKISGNLLSRYSSINEEKSGHVDINFGSQNFASLTSFSYNDFGDLKMGKRQNGTIPFFGERNYYIETVNGQDVLVQNSDKYVQKFSGYTQYDFMQKLRYKANNNTQHSLNFQYSTSSNIPRYDRLTDPSSSGLRNAEWYYGPQKRLLAIYAFDKKNIAQNTDVTANLAFQDVEESRHNRRFQNYNLQNRIEKVKAYSGDVTLKTTYKNAELTYGLEAYMDQLNSTAFSYNINTGAENSLDTRYPDGKNNMFRGDLYVYFNQTITPKTRWSMGGRVGYASLKSNIDDNSFFNLPFSSIEQSHLTYSGTLGISHSVSDIITLKGNISSGFRVPNIDDLAKIFESAPGNLIVPNEDLAPEKTITTDLSIHIRKKNNYDFEITYFYTRLFDAIVTDTFLFNGLSEVVYDSVNSTVLANQNKQKAFTTGISVGGKWSPVNHLLLQGSFNYTLGRIVDENGNQTPLDHIPPYYGKIGIGYTQSNYAVEAYMLYNGKKDIADYLLNGEDNEQYAPDGGMPAWQTYTIKASVKVLKSATLFTGIENIRDTQYRTFASGINAPGRNIYGGIKVSF